jgi:RNA polymerase sigma factor (sigma-70 family)
MSSIAETFAGYSRTLLNFIRGRVNRFEDAEDILQDVFYQFAKASDMINPIENAAAWLYRAARNKIIDHYKKKKDEPLPGYYDDEEDEYIVDEIADIINGEAVTPETAYLRSLILQEISDAISELPEEQRTVFAQTEIDGLSVKEVAEKTGAPIGTVLSRKRYAVTFLRKRLKELYDEVMTGDYLI